MYDTCVICLVMCQHLIKNTSLCPLLDYLSDSKSESWWLAIYDQQIIWPKIIFGLIFIPLDELKFQ